MYAVDRKTVRHFQRVAAYRPQTHHQQAAQQVDITGAQMDEAYSKLRRHCVKWIHMTLAMEGWF
jgi:hypothetical protein